MTWHQWHHTAPMSRRIGLSSAVARAKAWSFHSCQSIGWCEAERRYGLAECCRRLAGCSVKNALTSVKKKTIFRSAAARILLDGVSGSGIARIDRLASGESFILAVIVTNAIF